MGITIVAGAATAIGVALKIPLIPLIAIPAALLATIILRPMVTDRVKDERLIRLANTAARWSFSIFGLTASALGVILVAANSERNPLWAAGLTLSLAVGFLTALYLGFYFVFTRKH